MSFSETKINTVVDASIGFIELNRPKSLNALDTEMLHTIETQLLEWQSDSKIHAIFLHANLPKAFCAGGDVKNLILSKHQNRNISAGIEFFNQEYYTDCLVYQYQKPIVAWLDGITMGGGVGLTNGATLRLATEASTFAMPEVYIGFFPDVGGSKFLAELKDNSGLYLGMSGDRIEARAALAMGLIDAIVSTDDKLNIINLVRNFDFSNDKINDRQRFLQLLKAKHEVLLSPADGSLLEKLGALESPFFGQWKRIVSAFSTGTFVEMHKAIQGLDNSRRRSMQSQALAYLLIQSEKKNPTSWRDVFTKEWILAIALLSESNFSEGVRAVLIDKDQKPDWPAITEEEALREAQELLKPKIENQLAKKFANAGDDFGF